MDALNPLASCTRENASVPSSEDHVCKRCRQIPWEEILNRGDYEFDFVRVQVDNLRTLSCGVCQTINEILAERLGHSSNDDTIRVEIFCQALTDPNGDTGHTRSKLPTCVTLGAKVEGKWIQLSTTIAISKMPIDEVTQQFEDMHPSEVSIEGIKNWLLVCNTSHGHCATSNLFRELKALKLIDCFAKEVVQPQQPCKFATLSYVWGQNHAGTLSNLPATIEDSIQIVKSLGLRYLWVDRYCIDNDDPKDKHDQIQQMGDIYAYAELCLVAVAGTDPSYGLPGVTRCRAPPSVPRYVRMGDMTLVKWPAEATLDIAESAWASRAWTYQEGYFSRRRLFFTERQTLFICEGMCGSDAVFDDMTLSRSYLSHITDMLPKRPMWSGGSFKSALSMLEQYSQRLISFESDALNAIEGALNSLRHGLHPVHHICGVPICEERGSSRVSVALSWFHPRPCRKREEFPSWTSLGWKGRLAHLWNDPKLSDKLAIRAGTSETSLENISSLMETWFGKLGYPGYPTHLEITAPTLVLNLEKLHFPGTQERYHVCFSAPSRLKLYGLPFWDQDVDIEDQRGLFGIVLTGAVDVSSHTSWSFMIIRPKGQFYERIGLLKLDIDADILDLRTRKHDFLLQSADGMWLSEGECLKEIDAVTQLMRIMVDQAPTKSITLI